MDDLQSDEDWLLSVMLQVSLAHPFSSKVAFKFSPKICGELFVREKSLTSASGQKWTLSLKQLHNNGMMGICKTALNIVDTTRSIIIMYIMYIM